MQRRYLNPEALADWSAMFPQVVVCQVDSNTPAMYLQEMKRTIQRPVPMYHPSSCGKDE